ncbi:ATP-binding protein [Stenotrophomonas maltophilia]|uniref:ATP-binding protein n=1 Tax=Stenotrophomonas maltophilia TaxID=40324 RepID=UPI0021C897D6|nr:ATP-binding protein [Stenotrophomonas maltophilia]MCU1067745.1 response regulator [Stenotrophomonas maltophilia]MCU1074608.1 response regulator [Stenotrophomonas maltophilia]MCU1140150.1 response regulator [Stenotrophomonas maltophilia]
MRHHPPLRRRFLPTGLLVLLLLPAASAEDIRSPRWLPGSSVRVATAPSLRPLPAALADASSPPTLAHGYASLVARHAQLSFLERPYPTTAASILAVCHHEADLVMVFGGARHQSLPCPDLAASRRFRGGATLLAGRTGEWLPREMRELDGRVVAVVEGGPYAGWLRAHHPQIRLQQLPNRYAALKAVESGLADAAIGLEPTLRPLVRRHFNGSLRLQSFDSSFSTDLYLLVRHEDRQLLERIQQALREITLEEHAGLLRLWAGQTLPAAAGNALDWMQASPPRGWLLLAPLLIALPLLWRATGHLRARGDRSGAHAIGVISHEMRNSAQAVLASIELLGQSTLPKGERDLLAAASTASHALRSLLNRALDFSRLASGAFKPHPQPCDAAQLCRQALEAIRPEARRKGLQLHFDAGNASPSFILVDADALRQIASNLLANAVKFSDIGGVELRLQLMPAARPRELLLEVIDSGIGIAPAQVATLFQPFQQGSSGHQRGGSGLGLSIARELARAMGGDLTVHSVLGRGSRFILRLPVSPASASADAEDLCAGATPLAGLHLLLVEDHELNRHVIAEQLRRWGAEVCAVEDAASALAEQLRQPRPAALIDIGLRGIDGHALARELRGRAGQSIRLIALSARTGRRHRARCRRSGFDAVLAKPLRAAQLLPALGTARPDGLDTSVQSIEMDAAYIADIRDELGNLERVVDRADASALSHHAHRLQGTLQMLGQCGHAAIAAELADLAHDAAPDWADARRLLGVLLAGQGSRTAGTRSEP